MPEAMCSGGGGSAPGFNTPIEHHDIVIADAIEASLTVAAVDVGNADISPIRGGGAMDYDFIDSSHCS